MLISKLTSIVNMFTIIDVEKIKRKGSFMAEKNYKFIAEKVVKEVGGKDNIVRCGASVLRICIHLKDLEQVNIEDIQDLRIKRVSETNYGIDIECGTSAYIISNKINKLIKL